MTVYAKGIIIADEIKEDAYKTDLYLAGEWNGCIRDGYVFDCGCEIIGKAEDVLTRTN